MQPTANQLRDLRVAILVNLYRRAPRGRPAEELCRLINQEVPCGIAEVERQLAFLGEMVRSVPVTDLAPGLPPFWMITPQGMAKCEQEHLV